MSELISKCKNAREASYIISNISTVDKNDALIKMADKS